jgi:hypothetical protein
MPELMKMGQELRPVIMELAPKFQALAPQIKRETEEPGELGGPAEAPATGEALEDARQAIEDLLAEYDDAEAEKRFEDLVQLYVPEQREAAGETIEQVKAFIEAMETFAATGDEKVAGVGAALKQQLEASIAARQAIAKLRPVSPQKYAATITEGGGENPYEFWRVDDKWFMWDPELADPAKKDGLVSLFGSTGEKIETLTEQVDSGEVAPNMAMMNFQRIMMEFAAEMRKLKGKDSGADQPSPGRGRGRGTPSGVG